MPKKIAIAIAAYFPCWIIAFASVMISRGDGLSIEYLIPYFKRAWGFSAGELSGFIWLVSLALYVGFLAAWFIVARLHRSA